MISLRCLFGRHAPSPKPISNGGFRFSRCRRCGVDIVQSMFADWREPIKGFRIVWRTIETSQPAPVAKPTPAPRMFQSPPPSPRPGASADFMKADDQDFDWMSGPPPAKGAQAATRDDEARRKAGFIP